MFSEITVDIPDAVIDRAHRIGNVKSFARKIVHANDCAVHYLTSSQLSAILSLTFLSNFVLILKVCNAWFCAMQKM